MWGRFFFSLSVVFAVSAPCLFGLSLDFVFLFFWLSCSVAEAKLLLALAEGKYRMERCFFLPQFSLMQFFHYKLDFESHPESFKLKLIYLKFHRQTFMSDYNFSGKLD